MNKKFLIGMATFYGVMSFFSSNVWADSYTENNITTESALKTCLTQSTTEANCTLKRDIIMSEAVSITNIVNLNTNGYTISAATTSFANSGRGILTVANGATLNITGNGKITTEDTTVVAAIRLTEASTADSTKTATLNVDGATLEGHYYAIVGNGGRPNTKITLKNATIKGLNNNGNNGIFHPQDGILIIEEGTVIEGGTTGIEMRSGSLTMNGGKIISTSTAEEGSIAPSGSGSTADGYALAISQHTTKNPISVTINNGSVEGLRSIIVINPQNNPEEDCEKVSLEINGGTFTGTVEVDDTFSDVSGKMVRFITAGDFKKGIDNAFVADGSTIYNLDDNEVEVIKETSVEGLEGEQHISMIAKDELSQDEEDDLAAIEDINNLQTLQIIEISISESGSAITETEEPITFNRQIPESDRTPAEGYTRKWSVIRFHENEAEELACNYDEETGILTFSSDKFSTYLIGYTDTATPKAPDTSVVKK